jgi:hypothetical protein
MATRLSRIPVRFHRRNGSQMVPEIVERIFDGDESEGMNLAKLRNDWSVAWQEQEWGGQKDMSSVDLSSRRH